MNETELEEEFGELAEDLIVEAELLPDCTKAQLRTGLRMVVKSIQAKIAEISEELDDGE